MIKVTIEADGEEKRVITGDMVNAVILDKDGCKIALVSQPTYEGIAADKLVKSLTNLVQHSIKAFAQGDKATECMLHMCFALEMKQAAETRHKKESKEEKQDSKVDVEYHELNDLLEILRKAGEK